MKKKLVEKTKQTKEMIVLRIYYGKFYQKKANRIQKSTAANSSVKISEENDNMDIESTNFSEHNDANIIKKEQINMDQKNEKEDFFENKKDSMEIPYYQSQSPSPFFTTLIIYYKINFKINIFYFF